MLQDPKGTPLNADFSVIKRRVHWQTFLRSSHWVPQAERPTWTSNPDRLGTLGGWFPQTQSLPVRGLVTKPRFISDRIRKKSQTRSITQAQVSGPPPTPQAQNPSSEPGSPDPEPLRTPPAVTKVWVHVRSHLLFGCATSWSLGTQTSWHQRPPGQPSVAGLPSSDRVRQALWCNIATPTPGWGGGRS